MRRRLILLPGALEGEGETPLFDGIPAEARRLFERGRLNRISSHDGATPEAEWIGLDLQRYALEPGPLMVAALKAKPPERSVEFHLSLLSTDGSSVAIPSYTPTDEEARTLMTLAKRLETSRLKVVEGHGLDHGLVWEDGSIELRCLPPGDAAKVGIGPARPEGDGEPMLRRFIDDSVNLLSGLEMNAIRLEEGLPPLNLLWPWGPGFRPALPNLTVERGVSVRADSSSVRFSGLCQMVGYGHGDPWALGRGTNVKLEVMAESALKSAAWIGVLPDLGEFRAAGRHEESAWLGREVLSRLVAPLVREGAETPVQILVAATGIDGTGLAVDYASDGPPEEARLPFRAEVAQDRRLSIRPLHEIVAEALTA